MKGHEKRLANLPEYDLENLPDFVSGSAHFIRTHSTSSPRLYLARLRLSLPGTSRRPGWLNSAMQSNQDQPFYIYQISKYSMSTYAQVRRTAAGVSSVRIQAFDVLHRAAKETTSICRVATLPVVPYLINHLPSSISQCHHQCSK